MTVEEYYAAVHQLGLTPTQVPNVYRDRNGDCVHVPGPRNHTHAQVRETLDRLKTIVAP